jgi:hypothetical protein
MGINVEWQDEAGKVLSGAYDGEGNFARALSAADV